MAWKSPVKREIDWDAVLNARGGKVGTAVGGAVAPKAGTDVSADSDEVQGVQGSGVQCPLVFAGILNMDTYRSTRIYAGSVEISKAYIPGVLWGLTSSFVPQPS